MTNFQEVVSSNPVISRQNMVGLFVGNLADV